jgi:hypothetical protein
MWRTVGASVMGSSHVATQTRCQDYGAHAVVDTADGAALVVAVADGAGSAISSYHGAKTAVEAAIIFLQDELRAGREVEAGRIARCFEKARERVLEVAAEYDHRPRDYASTLLVAVATARSTVAAQIGDGAIVVDDGNLRVLTWPQQGEYANVTHFLVQNDALEHLTVALTGPARRIALFSDGLQNLALQYETKTPYEPFFDPFFAYLETSPKPDAQIQEELRAYLESDKVNSRTDDDKSLILAVRR